MATQESRNGENVTRIIVQHDTSNALGIASFVFGIISIFFLAPVFVPLALLFGIIAIIKKQLVWGVVGIVCGIIGFVTSPILLGILGLATFGANIDRKMTSPRTSTPQTYSQPSATIQPLPPAFLTFFHEYSAKAEKKAIALALDTNGRGCWGDSFGFSSQAQANDRALSECRNRRLSEHVNADCKLYAMGGSVVW